MGVDVNGLERVDLNPKVLAPSLTAARRLGAGWGEAAELLGAALWPRGVLPGEGTVAGDPRLEGAVQGRCSWAKTGQGPRRVLVLGRESWGCGRAGLSGPPLGKKSGFTEAIKKKHWRFQRGHLGLKTYVITTWKDPPAAAWRMAGSGQPRRLGGGQFLGTD